MKLQRLIGKRMRRPADVAALLRRGEINLRMAAAVYQTEPFQKIMRPVSHDPGEKRRLLILAPHQDDEAVGAGGTLLLAADAGVTIRVVYLTDGAEKGAEGNTSAVRSSEAHAACRVIGADAVEIGISNVRTDPSIDHVQRLATAVNEFAPDTILTP